MRVRVLRFGFYWGKTFLIALVMVILIQHFIFTPVKVRQCCQPYKMVIQQFYGS